MSRMVLFGRNSAGRCRMAEWYV